MDNQNQRMHASQGAGSQHTSMSNNQQQLNPLMNASQLGAVMDQANLQQGLNPNQVHLSQMFPNNPQMLPNNPQMLPNTPQQMIYQQSLTGVSDMIASLVPSCPGRTEGLGNPTASLEEAKRDAIASINANINASTSANANANANANGPAMAALQAQLMASVPQMNGPIPMIGSQNVTMIQPQQAAAFSQMQHTTTLGGVSIPPVPPNSSTALQVQAAAAAAAAAAAPPKGFHASKPGQCNDQNKSGTNPKRGKRRGSASMEQLSSEQKKELNRERNREHAKSTRARKKAYVSKLKELVDGLHAERSEEVRKRRVAVQHLAEVQRVRRAVVQKFLLFHADYESDPRKWITILEEEFHLKQPVTPYRSFRRVEIENSSCMEYRKTKGIDAIICDAASMSVMVERVGIRSVRWQHIKRDEFCRKEDARTGGMRIPRSIDPEGRMQHAISSLSSSSGYTTGNGSSEEEEKKKLRTLQTKAALASCETKKVSSTISGGSGEQGQSMNNDYHDYHAKPLPDPKLDSGGSAGTGSDPGNDSDNAVVGKHLCTDSSSGDEEKPQIGKKRKCPVPATLEILAKKRFPDTKLPGIHIGTKEADIPHTNPAVTDLSLGSNSTTTVRSNLPPNIAGSGGISHNVRPVTGIDSNPRLNSAPAVQLPPFLGIGKRAGSVSIASIASSTGNTPKASLSKPVNPLLSSRVQPVPQPVGDPILPQASQPTPAQPTPAQQVATLIGADNDAGSSEGSVAPQIQAFYHVNEDDMLITDDVLMCPFMFRTQDAVICGALSECVMPGMLRAKFSQRNKLLNIEMVYDAMGFMQQVGRASGNERVAEIIPNSLEMSLQPNSEDARVITAAKAPYSIVSTNALFTKMTKYTQLEIEKKDLSILEGKRTDPEAKIRPGKPVHDCPNVAKGRAACSTNTYYDKFGVAFVAYVSSYPLTNAKDQITHLLHVYKELPKFLS